MEACKEAGLKARGSKIKCKSQNKWLDQECKTEKKNLQSLGEKICHNTNDSDLRQLLRDKNKSFKQACRRKKREYISKGMSNINMQKTPKRPTVDSIFTLKMLVDKHVKSKPHKHRNLLFSCFVNFRKPSTVYPNRNYLTN